VLTDCRQNLVTRDRGSGPGYKRGAFGSSSSKSRMSILKRAGLSPSPAHTHMESNPRQLLAGRARCAIWTACKLLDEPFASREPMKYSVGDLSIDTGRQLVMRAAGPIPLPKLSYDLLLVLVRAAPNVVQSTN